MSDIDLNRVSVAPVDLPDQSAEISMSALLESTPLHSRQLVGSAVRIIQGSQQAMFPNDIRDHCDHLNCRGTRRHHAESSSQFVVDKIHYCFVHYICTNCQNAKKIFAVKIEPLAGKLTLPGYCTKIYQDPAFGAPIPKRLFKIIGEDNREYFLQARRAIARGLGVGAYAYYRRIVENTKFELISSVLEVAKATNALPSQITLLERARQETQFSKALVMLQDITAIPPVLLIDGHNPLGLLHDLLSEGIHQLTDAECLERAKESEIILGEIAERMQSALTERKAVKSAITSIMNRKPQRSHPNASIESQEKTE